MKKKWLSKITAVIAGIMAAALIIPLAACESCNDEASGNYEISVVSLGGIKLPDVSVTLMSGTNVVATGTTDENGLASFDIDGGDYTVSLGNLPAGYYVEENAVYKLNAAERKFALGVPSAVITGTTIPDTKIYATGDVMYDFTVTTPNNVVNGQAIASKKVTLSEYLNTGNKKAVLINFWGSGCPNCRDEFPLMQNAYEAYEDKIAVIALDHYRFYGDSEANVAQWQRDLNLTFDMAMDTADVALHFTIPGYPTSVMIDRYGVICEIHVGAITSQFDWNNLFAKYTSDNYTQGDIIIGGTGEENFVPDKPADYDKTMPSSSSIAKVLSPTISEIDYSMPESETMWPWEIDGEFIVPSNRRDGTTVHKSTTAVLTATFTISEGQVLAFDYMCNSHSSDTLQVAVYENNSEGGIGKSILTDSGLQTGFTTARKYIALSTGTYEVAFVYFKDYSNDDGDDCVYLKNLRLEDAYTSNDPLDVDYYAARRRNILLGGYQVHEKAELMEDGYYHITDHLNSDGTYPILYADFHHNTPYSRTNSIYGTYLSNTNNTIFDGKDYNRELKTYSTLASNSENGLVPVTQELKTVLDAIAKAESARYTEETWIEFCSFTVHYGSGNAAGDPIKGLAHFSAFDAVEYDPDDAATINQVYYSRPLKPRGLMYKFKAKTSGAYVFRSLITYEQATDEKDPLSADAELFLEDELLENNYYDNAHAIESNFDKIQREGDEYNFKLYHYLEAGETYYIVVSPGNMDSFDVTIPFVIERLGDRYEVLESCTEGSYIQGKDDKLILITNCEAVLGSDGYYYTTNGQPIYADFTCRSRMFGNFTIEELLNDYFYNTTYILKDAQGDIVLGDDGKPVMMKYTEHSKTPQTLNPGEPTAELPTRVLTHPFELKDSNGNLIEGQNLTERFRHYYELRDKDPDSLTNGMVHVDEGLKEIIELFFDNQLKKNNPKDSISPNEWMLACYYIRVISAET